MPRFKNELLSVPGRVFRDRCFRVVAVEAYLKAAKPSLLFDLGPKISGEGQRFSPPGDHRGLYVSTSLMTAGSEFANGREAWKRGDCPNHVTYDMEVTLKSVLDLTDAEVRRQLHISKAEVQSAWLGYAALNGGTWPPTWILGHEAHRCGRFDGILFPSTKHASGSCLLIFTERLKAGASGVTVLRQDGSVWERLP